MIVDDALEGGKDVVENVAEEGEGDDDDDDDEAEVFQSADEGYEEETNLKHPLQNDWTLWYS